MRPYWPAVGADSGPHVSRRSRQGSQLYHPLHLTKNCDIDGDKAAFFLPIILGNAWSTA
jgi:hypothetical protein